MKLGWVGRVGVATAIVLALAACAEKADKAGNDEVAAPTSKAESTKVLDAAYDSFVDASTGHFRAEAIFAGGELSTEGAWDIERQRGESVLTKPGDEEDGAVNGVFEMRFMAIGSHVYGGPSFGPMAKCWFDYGERVNELQGVSEENPYPWFHHAMMLPTEARALGFTSDSQDEIAVEVWADTALGVLFNKMMLAHADEIPTEQAWAPGTLMLKEGKFSTLTVPFGGVFDALEAAGLEFTSDEEMTLIDELSNESLTIQLDRFGEPVDIEAPPEDALMDASAGAQERGDPDLCAAASS